MNPQLLLLLALLVTACVQPGEASGPDYQAQLLAQDSVDPETGVGSFSIAERTLHHLDDFDQLSGPLYRIYRGGEAHIHQTHSGDVVGGTFSHGKSPDLRYALEHGVAVPRDYPTLIMLSAAFQFELVFDALEAHTGYSAEQVIERLGQLRVFFEPTVVLDDDTKLRVSLKFNAFFEPQGNLFGLARRSKDEDVPFAADPKVIGHEMGHAIFYLAFANATSEVCDADAAAQNLSDPFFPGRLELEYVISGINEGFADFHSFSITGSANPLANLEGYGQQRDLSVDSYDWTTLANALSLSHKVCNGTYYCVGTLFSRSLYQTLRSLKLDPRSDSDRATFMRDVVRALTTTQERMRSHADLPQASEQEAQCMSRDKGLEPGDGEVVGAFLEAFLEGLPEATRAALCSQLAQRFGEQGFPARYRGPCGP